MMRFARVGVLSPFQQAEHELAIAANSRESLARNVVHTMQRRVVFRPYVVTEVVGADESTEPVEGAY